jgi:Uma2 family endonuclease
MPRVNGGDIMTEMYRKKLPPAVQFWRLSVGQYERMIDAGILTDDDPVELLEGCLIKKMPRNPPHRLVTRRVRDSVERLLPSGWYFDSQEPMVTEDSEPEPDGMIVRGDSEQYYDRHPRASEVAVVIEVSDSTLQRDRVLKKRLYARAGIPVYVIINLPKRQVELYTDPTGPADEPDYQQRRDYGPTEAMPLLLDGQEIGVLAVRDLLP